MNEIKESKSMFIAVNKCSEVQVDELGTPLNGQRVFATDYDKGVVTLLRFRNGLLDGDIYDDEGNLIDVKPAVETSGHIEFWRKGALHRDGGEAAVCSDGFSYREYWENGERVNG